MVSDKVYVLSKKGKPLMPCSPRKARILLKEGKAFVKQRTPFTIQLTISLALGSRQTCRSGKGHVPRKKNQGGMPVREIKFRGKSVDSNKWVYGYYLADMLEKTHGDMVNWAYIREHSHEKTQVITHHVAKSSVGQFTGLKDRNGKEIYEGDVVACWGGEYCQGYWEHSERLVIKDIVEGCYRLGMFQPENTEIIGNIHENPELSG